MVVKQQHLFRAHSLAHLANGASVDHLPRLVRPHDWLLLAAVAVLVSAAAAWSVWGSLPQQVSGRGVLVRPRQLHVVQSLSGGRLLETTVRVGEVVQKGQRIGRLDQAELRQRLEADRGLLTALQTQNSLQTAAESRHTGLEAQQARLEKQGLEVEHANVAANLASSTALLPLLETRLAAQHELRRQGLIAAASRDLLEADQALRDKQAQLLSFRTRLEQIAGQLKQLETRSAALATNTLAATSVRSNEAHEISARIAAAETELARSGELVADHGGRVMEVFTAPGAVLAPGARILSVDGSQEPAPLVTLLYLPVGEGKRVAPGMTVQVVPDSVQRERFGGIVGTVQSVSPLPVSREGALATIGSPTLVDELLGRGAFLEVAVALTPDTGTESGFRWSASRGPALSITAGLTTRGLVTVESRSPLSYVLPILRETSGLF